MNPKVSVCVTAYNHAKYIGQCLQSLVDQETDFEYEIVVADDCSSDGTLEIVKDFSSRYPSLIRAYFHNENIGATANFVFVHHEAKGEYIAHVDGDDYALPGKLVALTKALDQNAAANMVWHRLKILNDKTNELVDDLIDLRLQPIGGFGRKDLLACGSVGGNSASMYRAEVRGQVDTSLPQFLDFFAAVERVGDGRGIWIDGFFGVYRRDVGVLAGQGQKIKILFKDHLNYFLMKYPENRRQINSLAFLLLLADLRNLRRPVTLRLFLRSFHLLSCVEFITRLRLYRILRLPAR